MLIGGLALVAAALFAGAALYVSLAEHPARMTQSDDAALAQWKPSYARGKMMQASLALIGGLLAIWAWRLEGCGFWLAGGLLLLANWPVTLLAIKPVNDLLNAIAPGKADQGTRALLVTWGRRHAIRTALGLGATAAMLVALQFPHPD